MSSRAAWASSWLCQEPAPATPCSCHNEPGAATALTPPLSAGWGNGAARALLPLLSPGVPGCVVVPVMQTGCVGVPALPSLGTARTPDLARLELTVATPRPPSSHHHQLGPPTPADHRPCPTAPLHHTPHCSSRYCPDHNDQATGRTRRAVWTTGGPCPPQTPRQLTRPEPRPGAAPQVWPLAPGCLFRPHHSAWEPCVAEPCLQRGRTPGTSPSPGEAASGLAALTQLNAAQQRERQKQLFGLWGKSFRSLTVVLGPTALASPPTSPPRGGKGTRFRQTTRMSPSAACSCQAVWLGAQGAPQNFLPVWARHTTSCSHRASCAPGVASAPSFSTDSRGALGGLGTGNCQKDPPRQTDPHPEPPSCSHTALLVTSIACAQSPAGNPHPQLLPHSLAAPGSLCQTPSPQCGWASTGSAMPTHTELWVGAGSTGHRNLAHSTGSQEE